MTQGADDGEIRELLRGAVDLYVHTNPELLPRRLDDVAMARELQADDFRAAMIWHQFAQTAERATLASTATGFDLRGSIILNGTVGGLNPIAAEYAIRMGARYVSMPTMSGSAYQAQMSDYARGASTLAGPVPVLDETGAALPALHDVLDVVAEYDVVVGLGYLGYVEAKAVLAAALEHRVRRIAVLRPYAGFGFTADQVAEAMAAPEVFLQFPASSLRASTGGGGQPGELTRADTAVAAPNPSAPAIAGAVKQYGADRCVLMSDTGWNELTALEWLMLGCRTLADEGVAAADLRTMVTDTPARLIGLE